MNFEDFLFASDCPPVKQHGEQLLEAGVCRETFDRPTDEVVQDIVDCGIPRIAAKDIVHAAQAYFAEEQQKMSRPMCIFWDVENVPIHPGVSGTEIAERIKKSMSAFGSLKKFNAYVSVEAHRANTTSEKRSQLQLSGVHIIDTPHRNSKEVADKMIIVDALNFAHSEKNGATIVLITGDADLAYMLFQMKAINSAWQTVLVTRGDMQAVLHTSANSYVRWETDILRGLVPSEATPAAPTASVRPALPTQPPSSSDGSATTAGTRVTSQEDQNANITAWINANAASSISPDDAEDADDESWRYETLTVAEEAEDDVSALLSIMVRKRAEGYLKPLKSQVGNELKDLNPIRFGSREVRTETFNRAVAEGKLREAGVGGFVTVELIGSAVAETTARRQESVSAAVPRVDSTLLRRLNNQDLNRLSMSMPFVLAIPSAAVPEGLCDESNMYVYQRSGMSYFFFRNAGHARRTIIRFGLDTSADDVELVNVRQSAFEMVTPSGGLAHLLQLMETAARRGDTQPFKTGIGAALAQRYSDRNQRVAIFQQAEEEGHIRSIGEGPAIRIALTSPPAATAVPPAASPSAADPRSGMEHLLRLMRDAADRGDTQPAKTEIGAALAQRYSDRNQRVAIFQQAEEEGHIRSIGEGPAIRIALTNSHVQPHAAGESTGSTTCSHEAEVVSNDQSSPYHASRNSDWTPRN